MITFNDILTLGGLTPSEVKILRHGLVGEPKVYDTWRNDRPAFEGYQARQGSNMIPENGFVASFVVSRADKTTFAGMYRNMGWTPTPVGSVDPLSGGVHTGGPWTHLRPRARSRLGAVRGQARHRVADWLCWAELASKG